MEQEIPSDVRQQLTNLLQSSGIYNRRDAAAKLGRLTTSYIPVVVTLMLAKEMDPDEKVRNAADAALRLPVHQAMVEQNSREILTAFQGERDKLLAKRTMARRTDQKVNVGQSIVVVCGIGGMALYFLLRGLTAASQYAQPQNPFEEALLREGNGYVILGIVAVVVVAILAVRLYIRMSNR